MAEHGLPALFTLLVWWSSTGLIIYLDGLRRETFRWTMLGATTLLLAGLFGLHALAWDTSTAGAWLGFVCGVLCWAWIEIAFLTGLVTGPRRTAIPPTTRGWPRLKAAIAVILWHELAIIVMAAAIVALTWQAPNQIGTWTFLAFWAMRQSAKLNVYLGVRNLSEAFLPDHLRYLESYFARRPMNVLFPLSVLAGVVACAQLAMAALAPGATGHEAVGFTLLATLVALGLLEHIFMVLPFSADALWRWGLASRPAAKPDAPQPTSAA
ncbi:putative photosynthetic complex assembly protein PuhE [Falsiroseomonas oryziterrae]|uniref:putative photosynthetic complex assembly protein PuhE n=1 Tax=Falsiroseomonas oryziterrae TaxID=2911368 RepID=UPI001EED3456|nr:putative photosynthetic complex assembly protein PuhE [Roseomonas sp. NPKOSM-4]